MEGFRVRIRGLFLAALDFQRQNFLLGVGHQEPLAACLAFSGDQVADPIAKVAGIEQQGFFALVLYFDP